jgi:hypothetical protein
MALRFRHTEKLKVSQTSGEKVQFFDNSDDPDAEQIFDDLFHENDGTLKVDESTNENISFGDVATVYACHIEADGDFDLSIDGGAAFSIKARTNSKGATLARFTAYVNPTTSINIANPSASAKLNGRYVVLGDLTA